MAKVNIGMATKEIERIDMQVGLYRTKLALFGSYIHEWSKTKIKQRIFITNNSERIQW